MLRHALLLLAATMPAAAAGSGAPPVARPVAGSATVMDGDTLEIGGRRLHLVGIDAPELGQTCEDGTGRSYPCGRRAARALREHIGARPVSCEPSLEAKSGSARAVCRVGTEDLGAWSVSHGYAVAVRAADPRATAYTVQESRAWAKRRGLWAGVFTAPGDWRRVTRRVEASAAPEDE